NCILGGHGFFLCGWFSERWARARQPQPCRLQGTDQWPVTHLSQGCRRERMDTRMPALARQRINEYRGFLARPQEARAPLSVVPLSWSAIPDQARSAPNWPLRWQSARTVPSACDPHIATHSLPSKCRLTAYNKNRRTTVKS